MTTEAVAVSVASIAKYTNMSKAIRWQVQFVTNSVQSPQKYCINIYDEQDGSWSGITQLQPGGSPFSTEEDNSDDYFAAIRKQTGTLEICTLLPGATDQYITLDELLPENNISRPVIVRNITNPMPLFQRTEWQGFLSCEAYSQDYTGIPQILQLPVISVLEAMASVQLNQTRSVGITTIRKALYNALNELNIQSGMSFYTHVRFSMTSWRIFDKLINQTVFFDQKEYNNENYTYYLVSGISAQDVIKRVCTFMGWVAREYGNEIYFEYIGEKIGMYRETFSDFGSDSQPIQIPSSRILHTDIEDLEWMGTDHQRSVEQGAKSVEVVAKLSRDNFSLKLPDFPIGDISTVEWVSIKYKSSNIKYYYSQLNYNNEAYNNNSYGYYAGSIERSGDYNYNATFLGQSTKEDFLNRLTLFPHASGQKYIAANPQIAGAILIRYAIEDDKTASHDFVSGLYCPLLPGNENIDAPIYKMWTLKTHTFWDGAFILKADMLFNALYRINSRNEQIMSDIVNDSYVDCDFEKMTIALRVGDMYYTGGQWTTTRGCFQVTLATSGFLNTIIPVNTYLTGPVTLEIWAGVTVGHNVNTLYEVIFKSLEVGFTFRPDYQSSDRSENHYIQLLGTNFRDDINVNTELATMLNNDLSPALIMNTPNVPMRTMNYDVEDGGVIVQEERRPELDLLNRLANYYSKARHRLELITKHPAHNAQPLALPMMNMNGINDGKVYLPLSESRDWQTDVCKLKCFELPEEPSES